MGLEKAQISILSLAAHLAKSHPRREPITPLKPEDLQAWANVKVNSNYIETNHPSSPGTPTRVITKYLWLLISGIALGCGTVVQGESIQALGGVWHKSCFKCKSCGEQFAQTGNQKVLGNYLWQHLCSRAQRYRI